MAKLQLENFLPYQLNRAAAAVSREFRETYGSDHDLTVPEWRVLVTLAQFGRLTAKTIGAHSSMHKTKVSRAVSALEGRRWLSRISNDDDRREEFLDLTATGISKYLEIVPEALAFEERILSRIGDGRNAILEMLKRV